MPIISLVLPNQPSIRLSVFGWTRIPVPGVFFLVMVPFFIRAQGPFFQTGKTTPVYFCALESVSICWCDRKENARTLTFNLRHPLHGLWLRIRAAPLRSRRGGCSGRVRRCSGRQCRFVDIVQCSSVMEWFYRWCVLASRRWWTKDSSWCREWCVKYPNAHDSSSNL